MTEKTSILELPYILPSQAQKHVTHNEALQRLDAVIQLVIASELPSPPQTLEEGDCFLVAPQASGQWSGKSGQLAFRQDGAWIFITPKEGWRAWFADRLKVLRQNGWQEMPLPKEAAVERMGIATSADASNRLAVASPASLFTHASAGGGHQVKVNKASQSDTASLLFQSGWSGRAEMGLAGNDAFSIKTSADGANWNVALSVSGAGHVSTPSRPVLRAGQAAGTVSPANGSVSGFSVLTVQQGGFGLGDTLSGTMKELRVPVTGLYLIVLSLSVLSSSGHSAAIRINGVASGLAVNGTASSAGTLQSASFLIALNENDRVTLAHTGTCQLSYGPGKTEVSMLML
jgi:hypothetical protein